MASIPGRSRPRAHHTHRARTVIVIRSGDSCAELAIAVVAPAIGNARRRDPACMGITGAHRGEADAARHEYRARPVSRGPVAELATPAPAIGGACDGDSTGMGMAGAHGREADATGHEYRARPASRGPVAELAGTVVAPAIGSARRPDPAGVEVSGAHLGKAEATRHKYWGRRAPAIGGARGRDPARMEIAGIHCGEADATYHEPQWEPDMTGVLPVPELAGLVVAPAIGSTRRGDPARMGIASAHRGERHERDGKRTARHAAQSRRARRERVADRKSVV